METVIGDVILHKCEEGEMSRGELAKDSNSISAVILEGLSMCTYDRASTSKVHHICAMLLSFMHLASLASFLKGTFTRVCPTIDKLIS